MNPKQTTVKLRLEFGPGLPVDVSAFLEPHAVRAILEAFSQAIAEERLAPQAVFKAKDDGVAVELSVTGFSAGAQPGVPTIHHIEWAGTATLDGKQLPASKEMHLDIFWFPTDRKILESIKAGHRRESIVPVLPAVTERFKPGTKVTFVEAQLGPLGEPIVKPGGEQLTVTLTKASDIREPWAGRLLYEIAWDPSDVTHDAIAVTPW